MQNKNIQAANKRNQVQQEVKAKAEEDVTKARELSARKREGGSTPQTPHSPHTPVTPGTPLSGRSSSTAADEEDAKKPQGSILEIPLPPMK
jgi:hypothetical protein